MCEWKRARALILRRPLPPSVSRRWRSRAAAFCIAFAHCREGSSRILRVSDPGSNNSNDKGGRGDGGGLSLSSFCSFYNISLNSLSLKRNFFPSSIPVCAAHPPFKRHFASCPRRNATLFSLFQPKNLRPTRNERLRCIPRRALVPPSDRPLSFPAAAPKFTPPWPQAAQLFFSLTYIPSPISRAPVQRAPPHTRSNQHTTHLDVLL